MKYNEYVAKAKAIHGDKYRYIYSANVEVRGNIKVVCEKHGLFLINHEKHLDGVGCPSCSKKKTYNLKRSSNERSYKIWRKMVNCCNESDRYRMCLEWKYYYSFRDWYEDNRADGYVLRFGFGKAKVISPKNCVFIPKGISQKIELSNYNEDCVFKLNKKWSARVHHNKEYHELGTFSNKEMALKAVKVFKRYKIAEELEKCVMDEEKKDRFLAHLRKDGYICKR